MTVIKSVCHFIADDDYIIKCEKHGTHITDGADMSLWVLGTAANELNEMKVICMGVFGEIN